MSRVYSTLEEIRMRVATRCGFGGSSAASTVIAPILNDFIRSAQNEIWAELGWNQREKLAEKTVGYEQDTVEYPLDCYMESVKQVAVEDGGYWYRLERGIDIEDWSYHNELSRPTKYEPNETLQLFPKADKPYKLRIVYTAVPSRLLTDDDRLSLDDELVFLLALVNAKYHYRQPDAQLIAQQYNRLLTHTKMRSRGRVVHKRRGSVSRADNLDAMYNRPVRG